LPSLSLSLLLSSFISNLIENGPGDEREGGKGEEVIQSFYVVQYGQVLLLCKKRKETVKILKREK
jgi:hypothetical protein